MNSRIHSADGKTGHIPRLRNKWILYRQHHSALIKQKIDKITASEICTYEFFIEKLLLILCSYYGFKHVETRI